MKRTVLLFTFALLVLSRSATAQEYGFGFVLDGGTSIAGAAGSTVQVTGHVTISASETGVGGWTCGFETSSPDGLEFCISASTESTGPADKQDLIQTVDVVNGNEVQTAGVLALFPDPTTFMLQDPGAPHAQCEGSGQATSTPTDPQNAGRRGVVDSTVLNIGQSLTDVVGLLIFPFAIDCVVPDAEAGATLDLAFVGRTDTPEEQEARLKGPGQPVANGVSASGATRSAQTLGSVSISIIPQPFVVSFEAAVGDITAVAGGSGSADGTLTVVSGPDNSGEGVAALAFSISLSGSDSVDIQSASTSQDLLDSLSNVSALAFESFHVSGDGGLDANDDGQGRGAVTGQVFALELTGGGETLSPNGSVVAVDFTVGGDFADDSANGESFSLDFVDGLRGPGAAINNSVTVLGKTVVPGSTTGASGDVTVVVAAAYVRCDPNNDLKNDIADAVWMISELFRVGPATACPDSADCDDDGTGGTMGDISYAIGYQFMGGMAPAAPFPGCGNDPASTPETCPAGSTGCP